MGVEFALGACLGFGLGGMVANWIWGRAYENLHNSWSDAYQKLGDDWSDLFQELMAKYKELLDASLGNRD